MSGNAQLIIEHLPEAAFMAGAVVGGALDELAVRRAAPERKAAAEALGEVAEDIISPSRLASVRRVAASSLLWGTALAAAVNAYAWQPEVPVSSMRPTVVTVLDASGATVVRDGGRPAETINGFAAKIAEVNGSSSKTLEAGAGTVTPLTPQEISNRQPIGDAPMPEATQNALDDQAQIKNGARESRQTTTTATVILTYGDTVGAAPDIADKAKRIKAPVFIVDVANDTPAEVTLQFKQIADQTGGKYWQAATVKPDVVAGEVKGALKHSQEIAPRPSEQAPDWSMRALGALAAAVGIPVFYRNRRNGSLTANGLTNKQTKRNGRK